MRKGLAAILQGVGVAIYIVAGIVGFFLCCRIIAAHWGFIGVVFAVVLLPIAFVAAPIYALVAHGDWWPLAFCYGPIVPLAVLWGLADVLGKGNEY